MFHLVGASIYICIHKHMYISCYIIIYMFIHMCICTYVWYVYIYTHARRLYFHDKGRAPSERSLAHRGCPEFEAGVAGTQSSGRIQKMDLR